MKYVGIDLHKNSITVCVVDGDRAKLTTRQFACSDVDRILEFFRGLGPFQAVVEATASYEWLLTLIEPLAQRVVLAHPGKLRVIAESTRKSDKVDARVLAEFLALDMIPQAYRPTPRQREHRGLVRHRQFLQKGRTQLRNKVRRVLSDYNADRRDLFSAKGLEYLASVALSAADRFIVLQMLEQLEALGAQLKLLGARLRLFAAAGPEPEQRHRQLLRGVPGVGEVTTEVVLAELGDVTRFRATKQAVAYAGLAAGVGGQGQGPGDHQAGLGAVALGPGGGVVATGAAVEVLAGRVRAVETAAWQPACGRGGGAAAHGGAGGAFAQRPGIS